jgi:hypothetical protein
MIPAVFGPEGRRDIPAWMLAVAVVVLVVAGFCGWVLVGMGTAPAQVAVNATVPLAR